MLVIQYAVGLAEAVGQHVRDHTVIRCYEEGLEEECLEIEGVMLWLQ